MNISPNQVGIGPLNLEKLTHFISLTDQPFISDFWANLLKNKALLFSHTSERFPKWCFLTQYIRDVFSVTGILVCINSLTVFMGYQATNAYPALTGRDGYMGHKKLYTSHISYVLSTDNLLTG